MSTYPHSGETETSRHYVEPPAISAEALAALKRISTANANSKPPAEAQPPAESAEPTGRIFDWASQPDFPPVKTIGQETRRAG